jgi:hypothetical protein
MRQADTILARFPGPVTLYPSRLRLLVGFVLCLGLTVFSYYLLLNAIEAWSSEVIWAAASILVIGGLAARLAIMLLLPGATGLTLDADGFAISGIFRRTRHSWRSVGGFRVHEPDDERLPPWVAFDTTGARRHGAKAAGALPINYPLPLEDLAWLMTQWRERALALPRPASVPRVGSAGRWP